jgi:hypothetical protein
MNFIDYIWNDIKKGAEWIRNWQQNRAKNYEESLRIKNAELDKKLELKRLEDGIRRKEAKLYPQRKQEQQFNSPEFMFGGLANRPSMMRTTRSSKKSRF